MASPKRNAVRNDVLMTLLLVLSGSPVVALFGIELVYSFTALLLGGILLKEGRPIFESRGVLVFVVFACLLTLQAIHFSFFSLANVLGFYCRLYIVYAVVRLIPNFGYTYVRVMHILCILALVAWGLSYLGLINKVVMLFPPYHVYKWDQVAVYALGFHTFFLDFSGVALRNAGIFWEPGAFAAYINISLVFLFIIRHQISFSEFRRVFFILSCALFSTQSTAGYVIYPLITILGFSSSFVKRVRPELFVVVGCMVFALGGVVLIYAFHQVDFIGEKISTQLLSAVETSSHDLGMNNTRFGSSLFDWFYIKESPLWGNGLHEVTRYRFHTFDNRVGGQGNGLTDFVAKFGFVGLVFFLLLLSKAFQAQMASPFRVAMTVFIVLATLIGEPLLNYPFYYSFFFLGMLGFSGGTIGNERAYVPYRSSNNLL